MKKILLLAAVAVFANPAMASKARMTALGNADHLTDDVQSVFDNPARLATMGDYITFEAGATNTASPVTFGTTTYESYENGLDANPGAEGGFTRSMGNAKTMFYMGRKSSFTDNARKAFGFLRQENPIEIQYAQKADMNWGIRFNYSSSDKKTGNQKKQSAMGVGFGAMASNWEAVAIMGLGSTATGNSAGGIINSVDANGNGVIDAATDLTSITADPDSKYTGTTGFKIAGAYKMGTVRLYGNYAMDGFKYESTVAGNSSLNGMKVEASGITLGAEDVMKTEAGQWFYGVSLAQSNQKTTLTAGEQKTTILAMPFIAGVEHTANSWLVLRSSITQNVILGSRKYDDGSITTYNDEANTINNNTKVAAGLGFKLGKWDIDGSLAAKTSGNVNATSFLTNVGMTYMF